MKTYNNGKPIHFAVYVNDYDDTALIYRNMMLEHIAIVKRPTTYIKCFNWDTNWTELVGIHVRHWNYLHEVSMDEIDFPLLVEKLAGRNLLIVDPSSDLGYE